MPVTHPAVRWVSDMIADRATRFAIGTYFELSYRLLTGSRAGRRFLRHAGPLRGLGVHGYTTTADLEALRTALGPDPGGPILDLGCGTGGIAIHVQRELGGTVIGLDASGRALAVARSDAQRHGVGAAVRFIRGSIRRPPRVGASAAYALDSLMFVPLDLDVLVGIRAALDGRARLFAAGLSVGASTRDPLADLAAAIGGEVVTSEDVTGALRRRSLARRSLARRLRGEDDVSLRGRFAMTLVILEEQVTMRAIHAGRLRRHRTVVDLRQRPPD